MWFYGGTADYWLELPGRWRVAFQRNMERIMARNDARLIDAVQAAQAKDQAYRDHLERIATGKLPDAEGEAGHTETPTVDLERMRAAGISIVIED